MSRLVGRGRPLLLGRFLGLVLWPLAGPAAAHSSSSSYLNLTVHEDRIAVRWAIALRDLDDAVGLDAASDGTITWGAVKRRFGAIDAYAIPRLGLSAEGARCTPGPIEHLADELSDGGYLVLRFEATCPKPVGALGVDYDLLFELDPQHRGLLNVVNGGAPQAAALSPTRRNASFSTVTDVGATFGEFFLTGVNHLLTGIDHLLFVSMLLVPAMLRRDTSSQSGWNPVPSFGPAFIETIKVLSAFTVAHAMTLTSAVLGYIHVPAQLIESLIALTIVLTAVDNIRPFLPQRRWMLAFGFGLIHGFGFANALGPLALPPMALAIALLAFNLGLESAQIGVAALVLPAGYAFRATRAYQARLLPGLSGAVAVLAFAWFVDRAAGLGMMPF